MKSSLAQIYNLQKLSFFVSFECKKKCAVHKTPCSRKNKRKSRNKRQKCSTINGQYEEEEFFLAQIRVAQQH